MWTRRQQLVGTGTAVAAGVLGGAKSAHALDYGTIDYLNTDWIREWGFRTPENEPGRVGGVVGGGGPELNRAGEVAKALQLILGAREHASSPYAVAKYFLQLVEKNPDGFPYNEEWPVKRANPLIVAFFTMTNLVPEEGDQTPWCAAFVNFCLAVAGRQMTFSASSGTFRSFGSLERNKFTAEPGDIVVFRKNGKAGDMRSDGSGSGHVGFFVASEGDRIRVLGGNQGSSERPRTTGMVSERSYRINTEELPNNDNMLTLASVRAMDGIPDADYG